MAEAVLDAGTTVDGGETTNNSGVTRPAWMSSLPDAYKAHDGLAKYPSIGDATKRLIELEEAEKTMVRIPGADAKPQERAEFYKRLGVPEKPDGYELAKPELPDTLYNAEMDTAFRAKAHELGLTPSAAKALHEWYYSTVSQNHKLAGEKILQERDTNLASLKKDWGENFNGNSLIAEQTVKKIGEAMGDDLMAYLHSEGFGNDPKFMKLFHYIGTKVMDDSVGSNSSGDGQTKDIAGTWFPNTPSMKK